MHVGLGGPSEALLTRRAGRSFGDPRLRVGLVGSSEALAYAAGW